MTAAEPIAPRSRISRFTLALNYLPLVQLVVGALVATQASSLGTGVLWALAWLYLLPPLACRLAFLIFGRPYGRALTQDDRAYQVWWFTLQWQVVFNRLPWLEEVLRLTPGLYALWLWLWGARVSPIVYWAPGAIVLDRPLVVIQTGAVIGAGAGLSGHAATIAPDGTYRVDVASVRVGRGAMMGVRSGLAAGAELAPGQMLPAGRMVRPFTRWDGARRSEVSSDGARDD